MAGPKGNSEFCFPKTLNIKIAKTPKDLFACLQLAQQICGGFKVHDLITCESKVQVVVSLWS